MLSTPSSNTDLLETTTMQPACWHSLTYQQLGRTYLSTQFSHILKFVNCELIKKLFQSSDEAVSWPSPATLAKAHRQAGSNQRSRKYAFVNLLKTKVAMLFSKYSLETAGEGSPQGKKMNNLAQNTLLILLLLFLASLLEL